MRADRKETLYGTTASVAECDAAWHVRHLHCNERAQPRNRPAEPHVQKVNGKSCAPARETGRARFIYKHKMEIFGIDEITFHMKMIKSFSSFMSFSINKIVETNKSDAKYKDLVDNLLLYMLFLKIENDFGNVFC